MFDMFFASHQGSWAFVAALFIVAYFLFTSHKNKPGKILHMILRLFFIIMLVSGVGMLFEMGWPLVYIVKGILAVVMIGLMEMSLGKAKRGENGMGAFIGVIVLLVIVALMGFNVITF
ncbi:YisL family protein [Geomicrobium sp. JCM 19039]|uniref:YisL family protein n=1 Tax=Geomicrobium sp. JCM 19039 TaxID=1460636 RepID=UPI00045F2CAD|nr:YisL family protein [Geomicrobium sp. JCM 19039]GAK11895.1 hypothetical protein JCM19039_1617 [Geomicrobium sp. JCM 19039]